MTCEQCGQPTEGYQVCNGDGHPHHHGRVHTLEHGLQMLCDDCHIKDKVAWLETGRGYATVAAIMRRERT